MKARDGFWTAVPGRGPRKDPGSSAGAEAAAMAIFSVYVVNKAGGLIYQHDSYAPRAEAEKTFSYPLDLLLKLHDERVLVAFGQRDGIRGAQGSGAGPRASGVGWGEGAALGAVGGCGGPRVPSAESWGWSLADPCPHLCSGPCSAGHQWSRRERQVHVRRERGAGVSG